MSNPTKGSVAGQPIQTGTVTKEYEDGFERTFGERKPVRGRFVYTSGGKPLEAPVRVDEDWRQPDSGPSHVSEEEVYGHAVATDGTPLDSRTKHREYMKANGLTMTSDFTNHWKQKAKEREALLKGEAQVNEVRELVGRAAYEARRKK